jgi:hypothetical protein
LRTWRDSSSDFGSIDIPMHPRPMAETRSSPILRWGNLGAIVGLYCRIKQDFEYWIDDVLEVDEIRRSV